MGSIFQSLPGIQMPVSEVTRTLTEMWQTDGGPGHPSPSEFRASQLNLILHFGLGTSAEEAQEQFDAAVGFAQRYPCRILVLCPFDMEGHSADNLLEAKLFSQCYLGESLREMCCTEALLLRYPLGESGYLENQVSVWLEADLPVYHWFHRVPADAIEERYRGFVKQCKRVLFDSCADDAKGIRAVDWPRPQALRDLSYARTLPVRQSLGQFLSSFSPEVLLDGLESITMRYSPGHRGESEAILSWIKVCLGQAAEQYAGEKPKVSFPVEALPEDSSLSLETVWTYGNGKSFAYNLESESGTAHLAADFGSGRIGFPLQINMLGPEQTLAEALFF